MNITDCQFSLYESSACPLSVPDLAVVASMCLMSFWWRVVHDHRQRCLLADDRREASAARDAEALQRLGFGVEHFEHRQQPRDREQLLDGRCHIEQLQRAAVAYGTRVRTD